MRGMLRYYYQVDGEGKPIKGSNRAGRRIPSGNFVEIPLTHNCCEDSADEATTGLYYVKIDSKGLPISGTLQLGKRSTYRWQRIASICCGVSDNDAPTASSVAFTGDLENGATLTGTYTYADTESDVEGVTTFRWYRANNGSGAGRAIISGATSSTYVPTLSDVGKYIQFGVTPKAVTGTLTGTQVLSAYSGPIVLVDVIAPTVSSMTATGANTVVVVFSEAVTGTIAGWSFSNGSAVGITSRSGDGTNTWTFTTSGTMAFGETLTASYAPGDVEDLAGNALASFTGSSITNSIAAPVLTAEWAYSATDPHTALSGSTDPFTYSGGSAVLASTSSNIVVDAHLMTDNDFIIIRVPASITTKTLWADDPVNAPFNNGGIPDSNFRAMVSFGGYDYYYSRVGMIFDHTSTSRVTLS